MTNEDFEPVRIRIMQEAYNLADRNDTEGYNSVKIMCSEVQNLLHRTWVGLTEWEREAIALECGAMSADWLVFMEAVERALKEKNT